MDMARLCIGGLVGNRAGFDVGGLGGEQEAAGEAGGRRSFQVLITVGTAEGAAAVELLRGWGYACSGLIPGYLEGGQHVAIMYRNFQAPYFEGNKLLDDGDKRLIASTGNDMQRDERTEGRW